jgi:hypothetical protein
MGGNDAAPPEVVLYGGAASAFSGFFWCGTEGVFSVEGSGLDVLVSGEVVEFAVADAVAEFSGGVGAGAGLFVSDLPEGDVFGGFSGFGHQISARKTQPHR